MDKAGIREVAKAAGVSISTVSRAFTRPELVSERTRRKVLDTADRLDFNISRSATALKSGQTYRVAMLMNEEITSWFNMEVFAGINSVMHDAGYDISLFQHVDTGENRRDFFTNLPVRRNVDAVFVTSFGVEPEEIQQLQRIHVPIIGFDDSAYADTVNLTTMRQDPFAMGRAAARKAVKLIAGETLENPYEVVRAQLVLRGTDSVYGGDR